MFGVISIVIIAVGIYFYATAVNSFDREGAVFVVVAGLMITAFFTLFVIPAIFSVDIVQEKRYPLQQFDQNYAVIVADKESTRVIYRTHWYEVDTLASVKMDSEAHVIERSVTQRTPAWSVWPVPTWSWGTETEVDLWVPEGTINYRTEK